MLPLLHLSIFVAFAAASGPTNHQTIRKSQTTQHTAKSSRLDGDVLPTSYRLTLRFEDDFVETNMFAGRAIIAITIGDITTRDSSFRFHAENLYIYSVVLTKKKQTIKTTFLRTDPVTRVRPVSNRPLPPGNYSLLIDYTGSLSERDMLGLYKSSYVDKTGKTHFLVASQFEDNYARRAFPCFDEPAIKATFEITVIYPKGYHVKSNTEGGSPVAADNPNLEKVIFPKTPIMSTYLVAILVSEFNCRQGDHFNFTVKIELCSQIDAEDPSAEFALDATPKILHFMTNFTKYIYGDIKKVTLAAIPDFVSGAMENWGLITFRESVLLWHNEESTAENKQNSLMVLAHELAHQWFGNVVTLNWWNDMFINEGFATFFSYYGADHVEPNWQLLKQFVLDEVQPALHLDCLGTSLPISYKTRRFEFQNRTSDISYVKGASIIRMVQHFLGSENFQKGIIRFIAKHALGTATSEQLWESFQEVPTNKPPPQDMTTIMDNWVNRPGYPLVFAVASGDDVIITQQEYSLSAIYNYHEWYVPITYHSSVDDATDTSTKEWLEPKKNLTLKGVLKNGAWVLLNNQQVGFYRVHYDETLLSRISAALKFNISSIDEISRAALVDDQFSLARSGWKSYSDVLNFLTFLKKDDSYYTWSAAFNSFSFLLQHTPNKGVRKYLINFIKEQMEALDKSSTSLVLPIDHVSTLRQVLLSTWQCELDEKYCLTDAVVKFRNYKACGGIKPPPDLKAIVYCYGLSNNNYCNDYGFLWEEYLQSRIPTEQRTILEALACTSNSYTREHFLTSALTGRIRYQYLTKVFQWVSFHSPDAVTHTVRFLLHNYNSILQLVGVKDFETMFYKVSGRINTHAQIDILRQFSQRKGVNSNVIRAVNRAIGLAEVRMAITETIEFDFSKYKSWAVAIRGNRYITLISLGYTLHFYFNVYL